MSALDEFNEQVGKNIENLGKDEDSKALSRIWIRETGYYKYSYNFRWLGVPIIQFPQDIIAMQEIIWSVQPTLIIETGVAFGGSLIFYASMLELLGIGGKVIGIDIDIREHNRKEIEKHKMFHKIQLIQGDSTSESVVRRVLNESEGHTRIMVVLDSNHTHEHVYKELEIYSKLVTIDSYIVVFDTIVEDVADKYQYPDRPWGKGNNPKTAVREFLKTHNDFIIDKEIENKLLITVAPDGFLKRIK